MEANSIRTNTLQRFKSLLNLLWFNRLFDTLERECSILDSEDVTVSVTSET